MAPEVGDYYFENPENAWNSNYELLGPGCRRMGRPPQGLSDKENPLEDLIDGFF